MARSRVGLLFGAATAIVLALAIASSRELSTPALDVEPRARAGGGETTSEPELSQPEAPDRPVAEPREPAPPVSAPLAEPAVARRATARRPRAEEPSPLPAIAVAEEPAQAAHLRVNAIPWATVELDGSPLGTTPLTRIDLPPGEHVLRFVNGVLGVERTEHIILAPDERRDVVVDLR